MLRDRRGNSIVMWSATFLVVVAAMGFLRLTLKRTLSDKMKQTSDYLLWTAYAPPIRIQIPEDRPIKQEPFPTTNVRSKTISQAQVTTREIQHKGLPMPRLNGLLWRTAESAQDERSAHATVADGASPLLKTIDLNTLVQ